MRTVVLSALGLLGLSLPALLPVQVAEPERLFPVAAGSQATAVTPSGLDVIGSQLAAFNAHDVDALVANLAKDFVWYSVDRDAARLELQGPDAFRRSMVGYFTAFPQARAEIDGDLGGGEFIAARERAFWPGPDGQEQSQASLAVYQVRDGLIHGVWYYPVETEAAEADPRSR